MKPVIITDSCCDLPLTCLKENNIDAPGLNVSYKGKSYEDDLGQTLKYDEFYKEVRNGELPLTSQINPNVFEDIFERYAKEEAPIIYIGFSSALSGCVNSALIAKRSIEEKFQNADITVIDTKSASLGEGLIVYNAIEMLKSGCSKEEIVNWIEGNKLKVNHWFTVDDLFHLKRGGRISSTAAVIGTLMNIKPVLHVDDEGRLVPVTKVKGRKKSITALFAKLKEMIINPENQTIFISHGDCIEDAEYLKGMILSEYKVKDVIVNYVGPGIGAHSGPGTLALFFIGDKR
jgi:DegV family protein with EDD domain